MPVSSDREVTNVNFIMFISFLFQLSLPKVVESFSATFLDADSTAKLHTFLSIFCTGRKIIDSKRDLLKVRAE